MRRFRRIAFCCIAISALFLERWANWRIFQFAPMVAKARQVGIAFPPCGVPLPETFKAGTAPRPATESYVEAIRLASDEATQAYDAMMERGDFFRDAHVAGGGDWDGFRCAPGHPAIGALFQGVQAAQGDLPASLQALWPVQKKDVLALAFVAKGAIAQVETAGSDPSALAQWTDLVRFGEHLRGCEPGHLLHYLGSAVEIRAATALSQLSPDAEKEAWKTRVGALVEQMDVIRKRASALRSNRALQIELLRSQEPLGWQWSEGAIPLSFALRAELEPRGFFWNWVSRSCLKRFQRSASSNPLLSGADARQMDGEALIQIREWMSTAAFQGPSRDLKRWQLEKIQAAG